MALFFSGNTYHFLLFFQVSSFTKSNCRDFMANDNPTEFHGVITFGGNAMSLITTCDGYA